MLTFVQDAGVRRRVDPRSEGRTGLTEAIEATRADRHRIGRFGADSSSSR